MSIGYRFDKATHPQQVLMWQMVICAYDFIEGTEVDIIAENENEHLNQFYADPED